MPPGLPNVTTNRPHSPSLKLVPESPLTWTVSPFMTPPREPLPGPFKQDWPLPAPCQGLSYSPKLTILLPHQQGISPLRGQHVPAWAAGETRV